jgi:hypothetical protein
MAVLAFENNGHYGWNASDPDHTVVQNGLNWLFSTASTVPISSASSAGNPDVSGDGFGIYWAGDSGDCVKGGTEAPDACVYETPMVLMAIVGSDAETAVTTMGPTGVTGRTYIAVAQDIVDWIAWAQNSKPGCCGVYEGGWRYDPQSGAGSDNSVSQWPVVGLLTAQLWGINAPSWVGTELQKWITADQDLTGTPATNAYYGAFDYLPGSGLFSPAETAAGIMELTYVGATNTSASILAAEGYLYKDWTPNGCTPSEGCGWNWNIGDLYDMYSVMKAMRETTPTPTVYITNYANTASINWYNGAGQYADSLLAKQGPDGHWNNWVSVNEDDDVSNYLGTAWGILILQQFTVHVPNNLAVQVVDTTSTPISGANVAAVGPTTQSGVTNSTGWVQWNRIQGGSYDVTASKNCYASTSQTVDLTKNTTITLTLEPASCVSKVPQFPIPPTAIAALAFLSLALFSARARSRNPRKLLKTS